MTQPTEDFTHVHRAALYRAAQINIGAELGYNHRGMAPPDIFTDLEKAGYLMVLDETRSVITGRGSQVLREWFERDVMHGCKLESISLEDMSHWSERWPGLKQLIERIETDATRP